LADANWVSYVILHYQLIIIDQNTYDKRAAMSARPTHFVRFLVHFFDDSQKKFLFPFYLPSPSVGGDDFVLSNKKIFSTFFRY
jgi:hypothetical protein